MILAHNMIASNNNRQLGINNKRLSRSSQKLSSGYRINYAADDAAGLAISEKMRGQIRGLNRSVMNANDGISLIQTAEGAMNEVHSILKRMEELSVQAANDTNTDDDRAAIQYEIEHLVVEIDRIADDTEFNTLKLLSGDYANPDMSLQQVPTDANRSRIQTSGPELVFIEMTQEFVTNQDPTGSNPTRSIPGVDAAADARFKNILKTQIVPQAVDSIVRAYPSTFGYLRGSSLGIGLKITNEPGSSVLASVTMGAGGTLDNIMLSYTLTVNVGHLSFDASGSISNRDDLEITIVHEMTHALMDETLTTGMLGRRADWSTGGAKFPLWFVEGMAQASAGGCYNENDWVNGGLGITASSTPASISAALAAHRLSQSSSDSAANYGTGYLAAMYLGYLANRGGTVSASGIARGLDKILNEIKNGNSLDYAIAEYTNNAYTDTTDFENNFASDPNAAQFILNLVTAVGEGTGGLVSNFFNRQSGFLPDSAAGNNSLFELDITNDQIRNEYPTGYPVVSGGGRSSDGTPVSGGGGGTGGGGIGGGNPLMIQVGANSNQLMAVYIGNISSTGIGVSSADVSTQASAENTISDVQAGIQYVAMQRASLGAYQNRLDHAVDGNANTSENLQASESSIRDTNMAKEMLQYSASQILQQASQAMLAQTTRMGNGILQLLQ